VTVALDVHRPRADWYPQQIGVDWTFLQVPVSEQMTAPAAPAADRILISRSREVKAGTANARLAPCRVMSSRLARRLLERGRNR
jgi:hypothetical protein